MSSTGQSPDGESVRRIRRQVEHAIEQLAALSGSNLSPTEFFEELLRKGLDGIDAPAGAVWIKSPQGFLQQQCQVNFGNIGMDDRPNGRLAHNELLRFAFDKGKPGLLGPRQRAEGERVAGNPTDYSLALAPIINDDNQPHGIVEIFQKSGWHPQDLITYTIQVAGYASNFLRNTSNRKIAGQEQVWTQLEVFSRQVHGSLNPTEVSYLVANEGRRLIGCDRVSIGIRHGRKTTVEAVSGADVVEKAGTHVRRMRQLFDEVIQWGEKLVYRGSRDETLPPKVLTALDAYLQEQNPKLLVLLPIRDEREKPKEKEPAKPVRSAVLMEVFDPPEDTLAIEQKLDVIAAHCAPALYNAAEMKRVPLKPLWWPLMRLQQGVGGKARFWLLFSVGAAALLIACMVFLKYPLKLDAKGKLAPVERHYVYSHSDGRILEFKVSPNSRVLPGGPIAILYKEQWAQEITAKKKDLEGLDQQIQQLANVPPELPTAEREVRLQNRLKLEIDRRKVAADLQIYSDVYRCDLTKPGYYTVTAPEIASARSTGRPEWAIVTPDFREEMTGKTIRPTDPIVRVTNPASGWEIVLKIPQKHHGQLLRAYGENPERDERGEFLWVDVLPVSAPQPRFVGKGKLYREKVSAEAVPNRDDQDQSEPVVYAYLRINSADIPEEFHLAEHLLVTDVEVSARIRCADHSVGYSLFYGVWEFLYEKVIFYLF